MATQDDASRTAQRPFGIRTFLIGDLRGYTRFTDQRGDEAAARLTLRFAGLANEVFTAHSGELPEVRGDEVLGVFVSPRDAVRAAVALMAALATETQANPDLPLRAGIGLDAGEATPVDGGFRGRALNMAARLCSRALPGEILVTPELAHLAGALEGVVFEDRGPVRLKGFSRPIRLHAAVPLGHDDAAVQVVGAPGAVEYRILGPMEVVDGGRPIALGGQRQRVVLAHLVLEANHVVSHDQLIERAWGEDAPPSARNALQTYVSHLRAALGPERIESKAPGYVLHVEPDEVDVSRFERLLRRARRQLASDPQQAIATLEEAISLWRGTPLADLAGIASLAGDVARLDELRVTALEDRVEALIALGEHRQVISELEALAVHHPRRERLWGNLMLALYRSGRQAEALEAFGRARSFLAREPGIEPSRELRDLHDRIVKQDPGLEPSGRPLRSYRLLDEIGQGAFGVVWRAVDPGIARDVAIKQIRPRGAEDPDFVRRFEREAQIVARLEHPHVVPLYDYWRDATGAYLVMRLMRAGSLADAIEGRRLGLKDVVRVLGHIADALSAAHRHGLVHRDIKPENILLDDDGNAYLSDFGIAEDESGATTATGTASGGDYFSPERERGEPATPRSDIFALGVVLREMVADRADLPPAARQVIARATAVEPSERYEDATTFAEAFGAVVGTAPEATRAIDRGGDGRNPYKGLRPFSEGDAADFFGRDAQVRRLVDGLRDARFLAVVGPSGSGKSSVVRAGLLPALRAGALPGSERWFYADMLPGSRPLEELEAVLLRIAATPPASLFEELERDERGLLRAARRVLPDGDAELLLVVDQFEEVFTLAEDERLRSEFLELLATAVSDPSSPVRIVVTLRADHYDRPLSYPVLAELVRAHSEIVVPLSAEEIERAIAGPAEGAGVVAERALIAEMIADVIDQPGALPLMQFALTETFERRTNGVMTLEAYRDAGGVTGALARRAEQLFARLNETGREAARQLFLRLVSVGEGAEDTRRLVRRAELAALEVDVRALDAVIDSFGRHRLLSFDRDPDTRGPTVEVAHEALLREWTRLRGWIDASREDVIVHRRLVTEAAEWNRSSQDPSFLLRGSRLAQVEGWAEATGLALSATERDYVQTSVAARRAEQEAEERRLAHERALERRSVLRLRALVGALTAAAIVATSLTVLAVGQRSKARREARTATARELAAAADANLSIDPERSVLLALQAVATTRQDGIVLQEAEQALHNAVQADRLLFTIRNPSTANVEYSPDGRLIATGGSAGGLAANDAFLWDARTGALVHRLQGHTEDVGSVVFNRDGSRLVTTALDDRTIVWDTESGRKLLDVAGAAGEAFGAAFSPDGTRIAVGSSVGRPVRILDALSGKVLQTLRFPDTGLCGPEFSPDGTRVTGAACFGDRNQVLVWDVATGEVALELAEGGMSAVYNPSGTRILTQSGGVWDARTGRRLFTLRGFSGSLLGTAWSADGTMIATGGSDGIARVWDAESGIQVFALAGHSGLVAMVDFSPDGRRLVTGGGDGTARVWDVTPGGGAEAFTVTQQNELESVVYSTDGSKLLMSGWGENGTWLLDPATGRRLRSYPNLYARGAFGPGAKTVVGAGCFDDLCPAPTVMDASGRRLHAFKAGDWGGGRPIAFGPSATVVIAEEGGTVTMWSLDSGSVIRTFGSASAGIGAEKDQQDLAFSRDGRLLAGIDSLAVVRVWNVSTGAEVLTFTAHRGLARAVAFSANGRMLATSAGDGAAIWEASTGKRIEEISASGSINDVVFSRDGTNLATAGDDGTARLWDVATGRELLRLGSNPTGLAGVALSPDGARLAAAGGDGTLRVFHLRTADLVRAARAGVTRGFTQAECRQYLHVTTCPASLRSSPSRTPAHPSGPPPHDGPEGAFRISIVPEDLPTGVFSKDDVSGVIGEYTLSLVQGNWYMHEEHPDGTFDTMGTYSVSGDRITFTDRFDAACFGWTWSARWSADANSVTFAGTSPKAGTTCLGLPGPEGPAFLETLFDSRLWPRVAHHEKGG